MSDLAEQFITGFGYGVQVVGFVVGVLLVGSVLAIASGAASMIKRKIRKCP